MDIGSETFSFFFFNSTTVEKRLRLFPMTIDD